MSARFSAFDEETQKTLPLGIRMRFGLVMGATPKKGGFGPTVGDDLLSFDETQAEQARRYGRQYSGREVARSSRYFSFVARQQALQKAASVIAPVFSTPQQAQASALHSSEQHPPTYAASARPLPSFVI